jgi:hypothetical protein
MVVGAIPDEVIEFFQLPNPSSRTMALASTQTLIEMSIRNFPVGKGRPARKAGNLAAIWEPNVSQPHVPQRPVPGIDLPSLLPESV